VTCPSHAILWERDGGEQLLAASLHSPVVDAYASLMIRVLASVVVTGAAASLTACSRGPESIAFKNAVFYQRDEPSANAQPFEERFPELDLGAQAPNPEYVGVSVIGSKIHLSRPKNWVIRAASNRAEQRYIEYVSPNEYVFAIYERVDSPEDPWRDVMARYEEGVKADGAELLGARVPMSTWNAQGRAYVVRREVRAARAPFISVSREFLARSDHRIVLVQILHQTGTLEPVSDELLRVLETMVIN